MAIERRGGKRAFRNHLQINLTFTASRSLAQSGRRTHIDIRCRKRWPYGSTILRTLFSYLSFRLDRYKAIRSTSRVPLLCALLSLPLAGCSSTVFDDAAQRSVNPKSIRQHFTSPSLSVVLRRSLACSALQLLLFSPILQITPLFRRRSINGGWVHGRMLNEEGECSSWSS